MVQSTYPASRRAAVLSDFGAASNLSVDDVPVPALAADEMLLRVKATSVNPIEWKIRQGLKLPVPTPAWRLLLGRPMILGIDFAGTVVAAGPDVKGYGVGDDVMGAFRFAGADAEYAVVRPDDRYTAIARKPPSVSFAEAGAMSFAGMVALAGLTTHGALPGKTNCRVLVIGASGGVGHLAVTKRCLGAALVVGVCSSRNTDFVRACGADEVVPYDRTPIQAIADAYPAWAGTFDLIFDAVGIDQSWTVLAPRLLTQDGRFVAAALPQSADGRAGEDVGLLGAIATAVRLALRRMTGRYRLHLRVHGRSSLQGRLCIAGAMDRRREGGRESGCQFHARPIGRRASRERDRPDDREDLGRDSLKHFRLTREPSWPGLTRPSILALGTHTMDARVNPRRLWRLARA
jgi:NADPH:quinone reductase-like Zn-dependent oxidoreductase